MLPGFRFLLAAVVLCLSMLVFGFGATALLRSAREEFASLPVRRAPPQVAFTQPQPLEAPPTLSMLRVETPEIKVSAPADTPVAIPQDIPAPTAAAAPEPEKLASLSLGAPAAETAVAEPARPEPLPVATVGPVEAPSVLIIAAPPAAVTEPWGDEPPTTVAAIAPAVMLDRPASTLTEADAEIVMLNVATLGGPAVDIEPAPLPKSKPVVTVKKKARVKVVKEKPAKRRRVASRAETQTATATPAPADTFGWQQPR